MEFLYPAKVIICPILCQHSRASPVLSQRETATYFSTATRLVNETFTKRARCLYCNMTAKRLQGKLFGGAKDAKDSKDGNGWFLRWQMLIPKAHRVPETLSL